MCYLQVLLAEQLPGYSAARCLADMDAWGYSFREGSAAAWFDGDGREARAWLLAHGLIDDTSRTRHTSSGSESFPIAPHSFVGFGASP